MRLKKTAMAAALSAVVAAGFAGQAQASTYAGSFLQISGLGVLITEDGTNPSPGATITTFSFVGTNTATLNGVSSPVQSATCGGLPGIPGVGTNDCGIAIALDPLAANAPGGAPVRANGDFTFFGTSLNNYSNSDSVISAAQLTGDAATATQQIAESEVQLSGTGSANAEIQSNTGFTFTFVLNGSATNELLIGFSADPDLLVAINQLNAFQFGSAQANVNASFSLTNGAGDAVTWAPQGSTNNDCTVDDALGFLCAELADPLDLNRNLSTSTNNTTLAYSDGRGTNSPDIGLQQFGLRISGLTNGVYTLAFNALTSTTIRSVVPEPTSLALLGIGLAGLGFAGRRSEKKRI